MVKATYKEFIGTCVGVRKHNDEYSFVLVKLENGKAITAIVDTDKAPARGEEIGITEKTESSKKQYRVWC